MRLVFAGTPEQAVPALEALVASPRHEVVAVLTRPDAPAGRGRSLHASPVKQAARAHGIPALTPRTLRDEGAQADLAALEPECIPVVAYGNLVPKAALAIPTVGWVNLHFSLLPAYRGAAPVQHAVWHGEEITGASTFLIEEGLDTGPVFGMVTESVGPRDTSGDLLGRLAVAGATLLLATLDGIEDGTVGAHPQAVEGVSLAPKLRPEQGEVDWSAHAVAIDRQIRAFTPAPGAWTLFRGERFKLGPVLPLPTATLPPGQIAADLVGTGSGDVRLGRVQPAGKPAMEAAAWARGARLQPGERFGA